jgi:hypothetical protein
MYLNRRDANEVRGNARHLYENQYLIRCARFNADLVQRRPSYNPGAPMTFESWLENQGSKITVLK